MGQLNSELFDGKNLSDLLEEIYTNQNQKKSQLEELINALKPLIKDLGDATLLVPLIKEYLDIGVKNDDQLIKLGNLVQRILQTDVIEDDFKIPDSEKEALLELAKKGAQL